MRETILLESFFSLRISRIFLPFLLITVLIGCGSDRLPVVVKLDATSHPLVAQYSIKSPNAGQVFVEFGTSTAYGLQTAIFDVAAGTTVPILVAGMKPSTAYHMRAKLQIDGKVAWIDNDRVFTTGALSVPPPTITVTRGGASSEAPGVELISFAPPAGSPPVLEALVTDRDGTPLWYYDAPGRIPSFLKLMPNGHFLVAISSVDNTIAPGLIREIDLAGNTIRELESTTLAQKLHDAAYAFDFEFFHHDFIPLDNGHVIVLGETEKDFTDLPGFPGTTTVQGDVLVDLDENWHPVWAWNAFDYLDVNRHLMGLPDWTHSNAVVYNPVDRNLMLSIRHQSWIIGIDYQNGSGSGRVLWRLGEDGDFALDGGDSKHWFYARHFPSMVTSSGSQVSLAVFDNGNLRVLDDQGTTCGPPPAPACYTRATLFQFDQSTMQAQLQWQYAPGAFSFWGGTNNQVPNGNIEFEMSAAFTPVLGSRVMEVTQTSGPEVVWQMDLTGGSSYRTYRIPSLYPSVSWP